MQDLKWWHGRVRVFSSSEFCWSGKNAYLCVLYAPLSCLVLSESTTTASSVYAPWANSPLSTSPHCFKTQNTPPQLNIFNHEEENECLKAWWHLHVYDSGGLVILLWRWSTFFLPLDTILSHHAVWYFQALMSQEVHVLHNLMSRTYLLQSEEWFYNWKGAQIKANLQYNYHPMKECQRQNLMTKAMMMTMLIFMLITWECIRT